MLLTDADFRKIKRLKKRQEEERMMKQMMKDKIGIQIQIRWMLSQ